MSGAAEIGEHRSHTLRLIAVDRGLERVAMPVVMVIPKAPTNRTRGRGLLGGSGEEQSAGRMMTAKRKLGEATGAPMPFRPVGIGTGELFIVVE